MRIQNRNLFRITRFLLFALPVLFRFLKRFRKGRKRLLVIKTDAIGDYILFRNYLEILTRSERYKDYEITLLGNRLWRSIAEKYDSNFVDHFIFISANDLYESPLQVIKLSFRLFINNYEIVLQPTYTRTFINDCIAGVTVAEKIIGFESDIESILPRYKAKTDKFYTKRLELPDDVFFEFDRSKFFFEKVLGEAIALDALCVPVNKLYETPAIVIFPGAGFAKRGWQKEHFLELIRLLIIQTSLHIKLAGGKSELEIGAFLMENLPVERVDNLIGTTSLPQLIDIIGNAALVVGNDTSAIHIAVAAKRKSVCILGGGHFERFVPYPQHFESAPVCCYYKMECYNCNWHCIFTSASNEPFPCISNVNVPDVWKAVLPLLQQYIN